MVHALDNVFSISKKRSFFENKPPTLQEKRKEVPAKLIYECSNDMQYLRQYFFIREYAYKVDLQLKNFSGQEDEIDAYSHFIIARQGHFCIGGTRLTISRINKRVALPLESPEFQVEDILPKLRYTNYCELGRTAILPQYRTGDGLDNMFKLSAEIAKEFGCSYMVGVSPPLTARRFKSLYKNLGYHAEILKEIKPPIKAIHEHLNLQFILVNLE